MRIEVLVVFLAVLVAVVSSAGNYGERTRSRSRSMTGKEQWNGYNAPQWRPYKSERTRIHKERTNRYQVQQKNIYSDAYQPVYHAQPTYENWHTVKPIEHRAKNVYSDVPYQPVYPVHPTYENWHTAKPIEHRAKNVYSDAYYWPPVQVRSRAKSYGPY